MLRTASSSFCISVSSSHGFISNRTDDLPAENEIRGNSECGIEKIKHKTAGPVVNKQINQSIRREACILSSLQML